MKIRHEAPHSELDWKVQAPLTVETPTGAVVQIENWSLSGLIWPEGVSETPKAGILAIPFQGVEIRFPVRFSQQDDTGMVTLEGLSGRQRETLALFYRSLLSGKMASSGDVITSLDTPVDLVPMGQTEDEQTAQPVSFIPRPVRVMLNVLTYVLIAVMVVGIIGNNIFTNLDRIDIQHGRVLAQTITSFPSRGGYVEAVEVAPGQTVSAGDVLIRLHTPEAQEKLQQAETALDLAEAAYSRAFAALQEIEAQETSQDAALRIAIASRLYTTFVGKRGFDDMRRQWLSMRQRDAALSAVSDPVSIVKELLVVEVKQRQQRLNAAINARKAQQDVVARAHVRAPTAGVVQEVNVHPGQYFTGAGNELLFERAVARSSIGWVSEKFAETLYIGMPATIGLNKNGEKIQFEGTVTDVQAGDNPERPGEFGIIATVTATDLSAEDSRTFLRIGAPVNLEAKRQLGERLRFWLRSKGLWFG